MGCATGVGVGFSLGASATAVSEADVSDMAGSDAVEIADEVCFLVLKRVWNKVLLREKYSWALEVESDERNPGINIDALIPVVENIVTHTYSNVPVSEAYTKE